MMKFYKYNFLALFFLFIFTFFSCENDREVLFTVNAANAPLQALSREAQEGTLDFSKPKKLEYRFSGAFSSPPNSSFNIEYDINPHIQGGNENYSLILKMGDNSWLLPTDTAAVHYSLPVDETFDGRFSITLESASTGQTPQSVFKIRSISFSDRRWFGFYTDDSGRFCVTPFVSKQDDSFVIDIPSAFRPNPLSTEIKVALSANVSALLEFAGYKVEPLLGANKLNKEIYLSPALFFTRGQLVLTADEVDIFRLSEMSEVKDFPIPIVADPAFVLDWPKRFWRSEAYEIFCWKDFPSLLIFDFADYAAQDRMLKRLAFFVEKTGFRGRLAPDSEIANLHAWNAHDYRAEDLANFFDTARKSNFPLLAEEKELEKILLDAKIISEDQGSITALEGGIVSISRESNDYLRSRFMVHEAFHGIFFIDEDFREFSRRRLAQFSPAAKRFIASFFEYQQYDIRDEYLYINEFMAHVLQQPVSEAADYFGSFLPRRLESTWRASALPQKNEASGTWPALESAFAAEARAFSDYVNSRWSLAAGRVWGLSIR